MKKKPLYIIILLSWMTLTVRPAIADERLNLSINICQFRFSNDTTLVEIYYGVAHQLDSLSANTTVLSSYLLGLTISQNDRIIVKNIWQTENQSNIANDLIIQKVLVDVMKYLLTPGNYDIKLVAKNLQNIALIDSIEIKNLTVRKIKSSQLEMSDIELAQNITTSKQEINKRFYKNNYEVIPNPLSLFGTDNPAVYYYVELYNIPLSIKTDSYWLKRTIVDNNGLPLPSMPIYNKRKKVKGNDAIEVGMFDVGQLPSGKYQLYFAVADSTGKEYALSSRSFFVYNPGVKLPDFASLPVEQQMASSELALLSDEDIETLVGVTNYMASNEQKAIMSGLKTTISKRLFLYSFWRDQDKNKNTPSLESLREIMQRIQYTNENFKQIKTPGWKTDRGRILILYGRPSLIQYYTNIPAFKEFQAWSYDDIEHGVVFIFGAIGSFGELKLIHSTKTGEIYNVGWFDLLKVTSGTTGVLSDFDTQINRGKTLNEIFRAQNLEPPRYLK